MVKVSVLLSTDYNSKNSKYYYNVNIHSALVILRLLLVNYRYYCLYPGIPFFKKKVIQVSYMQLTVAICMQVVDCNKASLHRATRSMYHFKTLCSKSVFLILFWNSQLCSPIHNFQAFKLQFTPIHIPCHIEVKELKIFPFSRNYGQCAKCRMAGLGVQSFQLSTGFRVEQPHMLNNSKNTDISRTLWKTDTVTIIISQGNVYVIPFCLYIVIQYMNPTVIYLFVYPRVKANWDLKRILCIGDLQYEVR